MTGQLSIINRADADALVLGSPTEEGGDFKVYKDALGNLALHVDADGDVLIGTDLMPLADDAYRLGSFTYYFTGTFSRSVYVNMLCRAERFAPDITVVGGLIPNLDLNWNLGSSTKRWNEGYFGAIRADHGASSFQDVRPVDDGLWNLGSSLLYWASLYIETIFARELIRPVSDNVVDLGTSTYEFKNLYLDGVAYIDQGEIHDDLRITTLEDVDADSVTTTVDSETLTLRGKYWDGVASVDRDAIIFHDIIDATPKSQIAIEIAGTRLLNIKDLPEIENLGLVRISGRTDLDALVLGSVTEEGGDIVIYKDAVGTVGFKVDADLGRVYVDRIDEITSGAGVRLEPNIGIGTAPDSTKLIELWKTFSLTTGWAHGLRVNVLNDQANPQGIIGLEFTAQASHTADTLAEVRGLYGAVWAKTNAIITNLRSVVAFCNVPSGYTPTITNVYGGYFGTFPLRDATITNFYGCRILKATLTALGSITRAYGLYVDEQTAGTTNWCALFEGDIQINSDKKLILEGSPTVKGDTYIMFNSAENRIEFYLNGVLEGWIDTTGFVSAP